MSGISNATKTILFSLGLSLSTQLANASDKIKDIDHTQINLLVKDTELSRPGLYEIISPISGAHVYIYMPADRKNVVIEPLPHALSVKGEYSK